jgi:hypothetical protein
VPRTATAVLSWCKHTAKIEFVNLDHTLDMEEVVEVRAAWREYPGSPQPYVVTLL